MSEQISWPRRRLRLHLKAFAPLGRLCDDLDAHGAYWPTGEGRMTQRHAIRGVARTQASGTMEKDTIAQVEIDGDGRLHITPAAHVFPQIHREAMEIHWDADRGSLGCPTPREWSYARWFQQAVAAAAAQGCALRLVAETTWVNIDPALKVELLRLAHVGVASDEEPILIHDLATMDRPRFVMMSPSQARGFCIRLWLELTIAGRSIWSDERLTADAQLNSLKWLNEMQHRVCGAYTSANHDTFAQLLEQAARYSNHAPDLKPRFHLAFDRAFLTATGDNDSPADPSL